MADQVLYSGVASITEAADTLSATATLTTAISGVLAVTEADDTLSSASTSLFWSPVSSTSESWSPVAAASEIWTAA